MSTMFVRLLIIALGLVTLVSSVDKLDEVPTVKNCYAVCTDENAPACQKGCKFAYALTFAPKDYAHNPSCDDSCKDAFSVDKEQEACKKGCDNYNNDVSVTVKLLPEQSSTGFSRLMFQHAMEMHDRMQKMLNNMLGRQGESDNVKVSNDNDDNGDGFFDRVRSKMSNWMQQLHGLFSGPASASQIPEENASDEEPAIVTRVRFFFFSKPEVDTEAIPVKDAASVDDKKMPHFGSSMCRGFMHGVCRALSNPFNVLLAFTLFALVVLFITQIVLFVRRRPRRDRGLDYTRLPTNEEAVEIKIPFDVDGELLKPTEKSALATEEIKA